MLEGLTNWLREQIQKVWDAFVAFMIWLVLNSLSVFLDAAVWVLNNVPVPQFLTQHTIGGLLGQAGSTILWFVDLFQIGPSMAVIASAMLFYLVRRVLTLGIW